MVLHFIVTLFKVFIDSLVEAFQSKFLLFPGQCYRVYFLNGQIDDGKMTGNKQKRKDARDVEPTTKSAMTNTERNVAKSDKDVYEKGL
jgi:hypothetical protein